MTKQLFGQDAAATKTETPWPKGSARCRERKQPAGGQHVRAARLTRDHLASVLAEPAGAVWALLPYWVEVDFAEWWRDNERDRRDGGSPLTNDDRETPAEERGPDDRGHTLSGLERGVAS